MTQILTQITFFLFSQMRKQNQKLISGISENLFLNLFVDAVYYETNKSKLTIANDSPNRERLADLNLRWFLLLFQSYFWIFMDLGYSTISNCVGNEGATFM